MASSAGAGGRRWEAQRVASLLLGIAIICEVAASLSLKGALETPGLYVAVVIGYVSSFVIFSRVLALGMPLSTAYGIWGALGVALTMVCSMVLFGEAATPASLGGLALIICGVLCVELGDRHSGTTVESDAPPGQEAAR